VIQVQHAPLRERLDDLPALVPELLAAAIVRERGVDAGRGRTTTPVGGARGSHDWPGNVRELRNYLEQSGLIAGLDALPLRAAKTELVERFERRYLTRLLAESGGNVAEAARRAGVDRATVFRTLRRTGLREG
jgi:DNA-binding NtrC family response regulator